MLTGKIVCGECGKSFGGARKFCGRNKLKYVTYRCYNRDRTGDTACHNSEIQRDLLEGFVLKQIADIVFDDKNARGMAGEVQGIPEGTRRPNRYEDCGLAGRVGADTGQDRQHCAGDRGGESTSRSLVEMLGEMEDRKDEIDRLIEEETKLISVPDVTEDDIRDQFAKARGLMRSGKLPELRQLINLYLEQMVVYKERVEVVIAGDADGGEDEGLC